MTINSILLHAAAEACELHCGPTRYAIELAKVFNAHLTALVLELDTVIPRSAYGQRIAAEARHDVAERNLDAIERAQRLRDITQRTGVAAEVVTDRSFAYTVPEIVAEHARLRDLTISGLDERGLLSEHAIAEYVLFQSGRPIIVVPDAFAGTLSFETVVVAWDFGRTAARAVSDALPFLRLAGQVVLITVGDEKEIDTSLTGDDVVSALERRGVRARYEQVQQGSRPISDAINSSAQGFGADLLVMGGYGHSRLREFVLGGATRGILRAPALPTLLSH